MIAISGREAKVIDVRTYRNFGRCHVALKKSLDGIELYNICYDINNIFDDNKNL